MIKGRIKNGKVILKKRHKYNVDTDSQELIVDGIRFDSKDEAKRYRELMLLQRAGEIGHLHVHPQYPIYWPGNDKRICIVELDFEYIDKHQQKHVEDVKGLDTAMSKLKRRLVEAAHGINVELIRYGA